MGDYGLSESKARKYWEDRFIKQGKRVVDFVKHDDGQAQRLFQERSNYIFNDTTMCLEGMRTLDIGCGTGRYSDQFTEYVGIDINPSMIEVAKKEYPGTSFYLYEDFILPKSVIDFNPELIFTCTVFQHCNDSLVKKILGTIRDMVEASKSTSNIRTFFFYENEQAKVSHVCGRTSDQYVDFLLGLFKVKSYCSKSHVVHNEKHTATYAICDLI